MTIEEQIFQLFEQGVNFSEGGGDDSHGISYGFTVSVIYKSGQYSYTFIEDQNNVRITDISLTLPKEKVLEQICTKHYKSKDDILRNLESNKPNAVYYKLESLLNKQSPLILKSGNETISLSKVEKLSEMKISGKNIEQIIDRYNWIVQNPIWQDQLLLHSN